MRRLEQPSNCRSRGKEFVHCLFCGVSSDSDEDEGHVMLTRRQVKDDIHLDRLKLHFKAKHKGQMPTEGMSLLDMGFTLHSSPIDEDVDIETVECDGPYS